MFKKITSMAITAILFATGLSGLFSTPASATTNLTPTLVVTGAPLPGMPASNISWQASDNLNLQFTVGSPTWSPSVTGSFATNTVYQATVLITPGMGFAFPSVNANAFALSGAGASGATVAHSAISAGAANATLVITFPDTGSGGGGGGGSICSSDLLLNTSTIKGVTFTKGTRQANSTDFNGGGSAFMGSLTLTSAEASGTGITMLSATGGASVRWLYVSPSINSWSNSDINTTSNLQGVTLANGRLFEIKVSGTGCTDYYRLRITVGSGSSSSSSQQSAQQVAIANVSSGAAYEMGTVAKGKATLSSQFKSNSAATVQQFSNAGYGVRNSNVAEKVSAAILKLPAADREKSEKIIEIINLENFVDRVAVLGTRTSVTSNDLVSRGLLPADSVYKYSVIQGLANYPDGSLNSMAKIEAAVKEQIAKVTASKLRTAAIKAKIAARNK
jgi:hypothetical protein